MIQGKPISENSTHPDDWRQSLIQRIVHDRKSVDDDFILELYHYQYRYNQVYRQYADLVQGSPEVATEVRDIPYLPISFFKTHDVRTGSWIPFLKFESSGTTGQQTSVHAVREEKLYLTNARACWKQYFKDINQYCILALLPSYLERGNSSLVRMVDYFISQSNYKESAFYLDEFDKLSQALTHVIDNNIPTLLIGVTYALLDFADEYPVDLKQVMVMETGGMKGRRAELPRDAVHDILKERFHQDKIYSEYGMTECFSQAYSRGDGRFDIPRSMRISLAELEDPRQRISSSAQGLSPRGRIQICDLANVDSCAFIATDDLGRWHDGQLEILGRIEASDLRGCNLMVD